MGLAKDLVIGFSIGLLFLGVIFLVWTIQDCIDNNFKKSEESICFKNFADKHCFKKGYVLKSFDIYRFSCDERSIVDYEFLDSEKEKCNEEKE